MYISDEQNNRIRKVTVLSGIISTIVGTGSVGYSGDGGAATSATLYYPRQIALDSSGTHNYSRKPQHFITFYALARQHLYR